MICLIRSEEDSKMTSSAKGPGSVSMARPKREAVQAVSTAGRTVISVNNPRYWRDRAAEMRASAETMKNPEAIAFTNSLADKYDKLADHALRRH
jgi:hypothetical protein